MERVLERARSGDPFWENVTGYLLSTGHTPPPDVPPAVEWFEAAADHGSSVARLNLAILHWLGVGVERDVELAEFWFLGTLQDRPGLSTLLRLSTVEDLVTDACTDPTHELGRGREVFVTFCSGCHGTDGVAAYAAAPSFAFGERLDGPDEELIESILFGHEDMPRWNDKLPRPWLVETLAYARTLEEGFEEGLLHLSYGVHDLRFSFHAESVAAGAGASPSTAATVSPPRKPDTLMDRCVVARSTFLTEGRHPRDPP